MKSTMGGGEGRRGLKVSKTFGVRQLRDLDETSGVLNSLLRIVED